MVRIIYKDIELFIKTKGAENTTLPPDTNISADHSNNCTQLCCNGNESSLSECLMTVKYNNTLSQTKAGLKCGGIFLVLQ